MKYNIADRSLYVSGPAKIHVVDGACKINFKEFQKGDFLTLAYAKSVDIIPDKKCEIEIEEGTAEEQDIPQYNADTVKIIEKLANKKIILVLGGSDVGKTTLIMQLANLLYERQKKVGIVDSDVGQSDIGIPATISYGLLDSKKVFMNEISAKKSFFVGSTSPKNHVLDMITGCKKMIEHALQDNCDNIIIDTTSLNTRKTGRMLKRAKIEQLKPDIIVTIQKENELLHLVKNYTNIINITPYDKIKLKSADDRFILRDKRWKKHFEFTKEHNIDLKETKLLNTLYRSGSRVSVSGRHFISEMLGCKIIYAEQLAEGYFVVIDGAPTKNYYEIYKIHRKKFEEGLLIGLLDKNFEFIDVGIIKEIDFKNEIMSIISPLDSIANIKHILVGEMRLSSIGDELGKIKAGSV